MPNDVTVVSIVTDYLIRHGYTGLYLEGECGCRVGDLMPCDGPCDGCQPGYWHEKTWTVDGLEDDDA